MIKTITMDRAGRVVVPLAVREKYGLTGGAYSLEVCESAEGILLRPHLVDVPAERHPSGWVVFRSSDEETTDPDAAVEAHRERRQREVRGEE